MTEVSDESQQEKDLTSSRPMLEGSKSTPLATAAGWGPPRRGQVSETRLQLQVGTTSGAASGAAASRSGGQSLDSVATLHLDHKPSMPMAAAPWLVAGLRGAHGETAAPPDKLKEDDALVTIYNTESTMTSSGTGTSVSSTMG